VSAVNDPRLLLLHEADNVLVARAPLPARESAIFDGEAVVLTAAIPLGHKAARRAIGVGEAIIKYGAPIGVATAAIARGDHVHTHNVRSAYTPTYSLEAARTDEEVEP
jgi:altronate dehydratase